VGSVRAIQRAAQRGYRCSSSNRPSEVEEHAIIPVAQRRFIGQHAARMLHPMSLGRQPLRERLFWLSGSADTRSTSPALPGLQRVGSRALE